MRVMCTFMYTNTIWSSHYIFVNEKRFQIVCTIEFHMNERVCMHLTGPMNLNMYYFENTIEFVYWKTESFVGVTMHYSESNSLLLCHSWCIYSENTHYFLGNKAFSVSNMHTCTLLRVKVCVRVCSTLSNIHYLGLDT